MRFHVHLLALALLPTSAFAQWVIPPGLNGAFQEAVDLVSGPSGLAIVNTDFGAEAVVLGCLLTQPEDVQFGQARGYEAVNGFVISNGFAPNVTETLPASPMVDSPTGCANLNGAVGGPPNCIGMDPTLASATGVSFTDDSASYSIEVSAMADTTCRISYNFVTFEDPTDTDFFDVFAVLVDGVVVAGGTSNGGPLAGTDPWTLSPSGSAPFEFHSMPPAAFWASPAWQTGRRALDLALPAGPHTINFRIADSGVADAGGACGESLDQVVTSSLFGGLETYASPRTGADSGIEIARVGHPAPTGGIHPDDFQVTATNVPSSGVLFLYMSRGVGPGITIPLFSPLEILFDLTLGPPVLVGTVPLTGASTAVYPPTPASLPAGLSGQFHFQWWGASGGNFVCSDGMLGIKL